MNAGPWQAPFDLARIHWFSLLRIPVLLILLSLPLVFQLVPRNRWYGYRTPRSLSSDADWRRLNRIAGIAIIAAALCSAAIKLAILVFVFGSPHHPRINLVDPLVLLLVIAAAAAFGER